MTIAQDLRYALRQLRRSPVFALTAIATLALGLGANTAIFSLLDQALVRSLPVREPRQLVILEGTGKAWEGHSSSHGGDQEAYFSYPMYRDLQAQGSRAFSGLIATAPADIGFARAGSAQQGRAEIVSGNYFSVLGVEAALGRVLTPANDAAPGANPVAVLSYDFWRDHLRADPSVVGGTVSINGRPFQILGVAARGFRSSIWGETPSVFVPMSMLDTILPGKGKRLSDHTDRWMNILGRLQPGETRAQAEVALAPLWHALRAEELKALGHRSEHFTDEFLTRSRLRVLDGARGFSYDRDTYEKPLIAVMAMALLVLLMAGVNVASLLLVRSSARVREFSVRYALGAGFARILKQLLLEGLLLGVAGAAGAMLLAPIAIRVLVDRLTGDQAYGDFSAALDLRLVAFNFAVALGLGVIFSLAPALDLRRLNLSSSLRQGTTSAGAALTLRRAIVCLQVGLSVLLLVGAGLFVRTMQKLRAVDVGFSTEHLVTFGINPRLAGYQPAAVPVLHQKVIGTLQALPGVEAVAATDDPELAGHGQGGNVTVSGFSAPPDTQYDVEEPFINPPYFSAMRVSLLAGRAFTDADDAAHPHVAIVNETFARHFCGSPQSCLGRRAASGGGDRTTLDLEIVGVVRDTRHESIRESVSPTLFRPLRQQESPALLYLYLRTAGDPEQSMLAVRRAMQQLDPSLVLVALRTMDAQIDDSLSNDRMVALLAVSFGVLATLLTGVGLYGVLAYATAQRTREIGVRIALGSSRLAVARLVLAEVLLLAGIGVAVAVPVALALGRLLGSQLFGVSPADPVALSIAPLLVALVALAAALIPARRAAFVNPTEALRSE